MYEYAAMGVAESGYDQYAAMGVADSGHGQQQWVWLINKCNTRGHV